MDYPPTSSGQSGLEHVSNQFQEIHARGGSIVGTLIANADERERVLESLQETLDKMRKNQRRRNAGFDHGKLGFNHSGRGISYRPASVTKGMHARRPGLYQKKASLWSRVVLFFSKLPRMLPL